MQKLHPLKTAGGTQNIRIITFSDVLRLIVHSTLPAAERFEVWVFEEVLPVNDDPGRPPRLTAWKPATAGRWRTAKTSPPCSTSGMTMF